MSRIPNNLNIDPTMGQPEEEPPELPETSPEAESESAPETPETPPSAEDTGKKLLRVSLRNGKTYTGETEREILQALAEDFDKLNADSVERQRQTTEAKGKVRYQEEHKAPEGYDDQKYLDLLGKDTLAARRYQDKYYYGLDDETDPAEAFRFSYNLADRVADTLEVAEFQRMNKGPDGKPVFLAQDDAERLLHEIDREGLQLTARNLSAMYHELVSRNVIRPPAPQEAESTNVQYEDIEPRRSRGQTAPRVPGNGARERTVAVNPYTMTLDQIKAELKKQGALDE